MSAKARWTTENLGSYVFHAKKLVAAVWPYGSSIFQHLL
jgi:hypothetical protein